MSGGPSCLVLIQFEQKLEPLYKGACSFTFRKIGSKPLLLYGGGSIQNTMGRILHAVTHKT